MGPFPTETWHQILADCKASREQITLVCRLWTSITYSNPHLWSHIHLGPHQFSHPDCLTFLQRRLDRARNLPLSLFLRVDRTVKTSELDGVCSTIASSRAHGPINALYISAQIAPVVTYILELFNPQLSGLANLTFDVDDFRETSIEGFTDDWFPAFYFEQVPLPLPMLRSLSVAAIDFCIPFSISANFVHLTTLVITQPFSDYPPGVYAILLLLQHTPNLETLYCKTSDIWSRQVVQNQLAIHDLTLPILLPKLTCAAVTVPGTGGDVLACIDAPMLRDLHLDGSRSLLMFKHSGPALSDTLILYTLHTVAARSPGLRRLAITEVTLSLYDWRWLLCGQRLYERGDHAWESHAWNQRERAEVSNDGIILPFPCLETVAVRDFRAARYCLFDNEVLYWYAKSPALTTLRRIVLHGCTAIDGVYLIRAFRSLRDRVGADRFDLEAEFVGCNYIRPSYRRWMERHGVRVKVEDETEDRVAAAKKAEMEWWTRHPEVVEALKLKDGDWGWEEAREEYPWWISDVRSLDPKDSWVF